MEESQTKEQSPKQFCERCFEQGDRKSQQNELELVLELHGDFLEEEEVCGCRNKWRRATMGPRGRGRAQGVGRALHPRGQVDARLITHKYRGSQQLSRVEYSTQIYWFDTRGAKEYSQVLAAALSIQPHLET